MISSRICTVRFLETVLFTTVFAFFFRIYRATEILKIIKNKNEISRVKLKRNNKNKFLLISETIKQNI